MTLAVPSSAFQDATITEAVRLVEEVGEHDGLPALRAGVAAGPVVLRHGDVYGPPAKLRGRALTYFQAMAATTPGHGPFLCGLEKSGAMVDYARQLARHDELDEIQDLVDVVFLGCRGHGKSPLKAFG